jgi:hypothetical protein
MERAMKDIRKHAQEVQAYRTAVVMAFAILASTWLSQAQVSVARSPVLPTAPSALIGTGMAGGGGSSAASSPASATVKGTVLDTTGALIPGAKVEVDSNLKEDRKVILAGDDGAFQLNALKPGIPYVIRVSTDGAATWTSDPIVLQPGQALTLNDIRLKMETTDSITVSVSRNEIATAQIQLETQQRMFGVIPNFYTVYDGANAVPLTSKLKFKLAMRMSIDPVTIAGVAFMAGVKQAAKTPNYQMGAIGYAQRLGETAATGFGDILIGGAVLPSLLHQDPRYFYQGRGTKKSRLMHALSAAVVAHGDNGRSEFNTSTVGGDLAASALQMAYYPKANRTALTFAGQFGLATAERTLNAIAQEFLFARFTSKAKFHADH